MNWQCPKCGRAFKHRNQSHSCVKVRPEDLFTGKSPVTYSLYEKLKTRVQKIGEVSIHSSRSMINFTGGGTFMVAKPKKEWLELEIISNEEQIVPPVYKSMHFSKNRYSLYARIETEDDISAKFMDLVKKAYKLSC